MRQVWVYFIFAVMGLSNCFAQPIRVAIVGLEHGHVAGFLKQFPNQQEVQLVGIVDADATLSHRYAQQFHLDSSLFYTQLDAMFAACHPQALLVYTSVGEYRRVIEAAAQHGLSVMVEKPLTMSPRARWATCAEWWFTMATRDPRRSGCRRSFSSGWRIRSKTAMAPCTILAAMARTWLPGSCTGR